MREFTEKSYFYSGRGVHEKPIYGGNCLKKGTWTVCRSKGEGGLGEKEGGGGLRKGGRWYLNARYALLKCFICSFEKHKKRKFKIHASKPTYWDNFGNQTFWPNLAQTTEANWLNWNQRSGRIFFHFFGKIFSSNGTKRYEKSETRFFNSWKNGAKTTKPNLR